MSTAQSDSRTTRSATLPIKKCPTTERLRPCTRSTSRSASARIITSTGKPISLRIRIVRTHDGGWSEELKRIKVVEDRLLEVELFERLEQTFKPSGHQKPPARRAGLPEGDAGRLLSKQSGFAGYRDRARLRPLITHLLGEPDLRTDLHPVE